MEQQMTKQEKEQKLKDLKVAAYDALAAAEKYQADLQIINDAILKVSQTVCDDEIVDVEETNAKEEDKEVKE